MFGFLRLPLRTNRLKLKWVLLTVMMCSLGVLSACRQGPDEDQRARDVARRQEQCKDEAHCGDSSQRPPYDEATQRLNKWNDRWFVAPREYQLSGSLGFYWPSKRPATERSAPGDVKIELLPRSHDLPAPPVGYIRFEAAEREGRILRREVLRAGLERISYFYKNPSTGEINKSHPALAFVATNRKTPDGQPPVFACELSTDPANSGGAAGFMWRNGIFVEILVRSGNVCEDWPELYDEIARILSLVKDAQQTQTTNPGNVAK